MCWAAFTTLALPHAGHSWLPTAVLFGRAELASRGPPSALPNLWPGNWRSKMSFSDSGVQLGSKSTYRCAATPPENRPIIASLLPQPRLPRSCRKNPGQPRDSRGFAPLSPLASQGARSAAPGSLRNGTRQDLQALGPQPALSHIARWPRLRRHGKRVGHWVHGSEATGLCEVMAFSR